MLFAAVTDAELAMQHNGGITAAAITVAVAPIAAFGTILLNPIPTRSRFYGDVIG